MSTANRCTIRSPRDAIRAGIGLLTEDRKQQGLVLTMSTARKHHDGCPGPADARSVHQPAAKKRRWRRASSTAWRSRRPSQDQLAINLSGGTQQKVVLSKWMATKPRVLIFDEPTRGIDVGAKVEIYKLINELARRRRRHPHDQLGAARGAGHE